MGKQWDEEQGKGRRWSEEKGWEREAAPTVKKGYLAEIRLMGYHSHLKPTGSRAGNYLAQPQDSLVTPEVLSSDWE